MYARNRSSADDCDGSAPAPPAYTLKPAMSTAATLQRGGRCMDRPLRLTVQCVLHDATVRSVTVALEFVDIPAGAATSGQDPIEGNAVRVRQLQAAAVT